MNLKELSEKIQSKIDQATDNHYQLGSNTLKFDEKIKKIIKDEVVGLDQKLQNRIQSEFFGFGPLESLFQDENITEILINGCDSIWYEKDGQMQSHLDTFLSTITFRNVMDRICDAAKVHPTAEHPICDGHLGPFRLNYVRSEVHPETDILSLRRHPENSWTLAALQKSGWCTSQEETLIRHWINSGKNFIVIGPTSSGKTSVMSACLTEIEENERVLILEDSSEIKIPNKISTKLLTRKDSQGTLPEINLSDLLRTALRLRPDRLIVGEMRGPEAKDFLMALSSGHKGSLSSLHAEDAAQALMRLEMLVQLGAPQWSVTAIRRLIHLSLDGVLVTGRDHHGQRRFKGLYSLSSLEDNGFTLERSDSEMLSAICSDRGPSLSVNSF